jgi:hypothetical protein
LERPLKGPGEGTVKEASRPFSLSSSWAYPVPSLLAWVSLAYLFSPSEGKTIITLDASLTIDREPDQETASLLTPEIEETDDCDERIRFFRGIVFGTLFSAPIWALILWIVL